MLVEGESRKNPNVLSGYIRTSKLVNFVAPKNVVGKLVRVKITEAKTWSLNGEMIEVVQPVEVNA